MALGHRSVAEAQQRISSREFAEWVAYDRQCPIGSERMEANIANLAWRVANALRGKGQAPFDIEDFLMPFRERKKPSAAELQAAFDGYAVRHNRKGVK